MPHRQVVLVPGVLGAWLRPSAATPEAGLGRPRSGSAIRGTPSSALPRTHTGTRHARRAAGRVQPAAIGSRESAHLAKGETPDVPASSGSERVAAGDVRTGVVRWGDLPEVPAGTGPCVRGDRNDRAGQTDGARTPVPVDDVGSGVEPVWDLPDDPVLARVTRTVSR